MAVKLGTEEKKKVYILGGLVVTALAVYFMNSGNPSDNYVAPPAANRGASTSPTGTSVATAPRTRRPVDRALREFRPTLKKKPEDRPDPTTIDPTLRLDLLARLQKVNVEGSHRNIFEFGQAPPPKVEIAKAPAKVPSPIADAAAVAKAERAAIADAVPKAPPIPLKFYGYVSALNVGNKRAFFMEGEDIHVVTEGDVVKQRYKIVRIGINSVIVEDTQFKSQQTLPLEEQPG